MFKLFRKTFPKQGDVLSRPIEQAAAEKTQADMDALFVAAAYDDSAAERTDIPTIPIGEARCACF